MYDGPGLTGVLEEDDDDDLEFDEAEIIKNYNEFFGDVLPEFKKYGNMVNFKVCRNHASHLRGNVYAQYDTEDAARRAFMAFNGRFYATKKLVCEFVPITKWKPAICGLFDRSICPRGKQCNFLHVFRNPNGEYADEERPYQRQKDSDRDRDRRGDRDSDRHRKDRDDREHHRDRDRDHDHDHKRRHRHRSRSPRRRSHSQSHSRSRSRSPRRSRSPEDRRKS